MKSLKGSLPNMQWIQRIEIIPNGYKLKKICMGMREIAGDACIGVSVELLGYAWSARSMCVGLVLRYLLVRTV